MSVLKSPLPLELPQRFDTETVDAAKGILILLVIFGHATNFWTPEPFATFSIKFYHVACFLLFPFIYDVKPITKQYAIDRIARYYIPFAIFLIGYGVLYLIAIRGVDEALPWIVDVGEALFFGTAPFLDNASGLRALWFMPTLIALVFLCAAFIGNLQKPLWMLLICGAFLHIASGFFQTPLKFHMPFGLVAAMYLLFLGLVIRHLCVAIPRRYLEKLSTSFLLLALIGICGAYMAGTLIKFPVLALPNIMNPLALIIHDAIIISMFMFLITTKWFKGFSSLRWLGQNSLTLYLTHLLFLAGCMQIATKLFDTGRVDYASALIVLWIFTMALCGGVVCAMILNKFEALKAIVMPRTWNEWPPAKVLKKG